MTKKSLYKDQELRKALFSFQDLMDRLTCPFMPLKQLSKQVNEEGELSSDKLYVGIRHTEWTEQRRRMFETLLNQWRIDFKETERGYEFQLDDVDVDMQIIRRNYKFFEKPDIKFFGVTEFLIPNPLDVYLKSQHLIK